MIHSLCWLFNSDRRSAVPSALSIPASGRLHDLIPRTYAMEHLRLPEAAMPDVPITPQTHKPGTSPGLFI